MVRRSMGRCKVADCFTAYGEFRAVGAHIEGTLDLVGANLINPKGAALILGDTCIGGSMLANGLRAEGAVRAYLAHIGGALVLSSATLRNPDGEALVLNGAEITGGWVGGNGLRLKGAKSPSRLTSSPITAACPLPPLKCGLRP